MIPTQPVRRSYSNNFQFIVKSLVFVISLLLLVGCGARQVLIVPDYSNPQYQQDNLNRSDVEVVGTIDVRNMPPNKLGTAKVGMFNSKVPYLLNEPASEFVTKSINTILGADPHAERVCPVTVHIEVFSVGEKKGLMKESGAAGCRLSFSFPVSADSVSVIKVKARHEAKSFMDVTSSMESLLYECVADCTRQFLVESYDPAPSHLMKDRADARLGFGSDQSLKVSEGFAAPSVSSPSRNIQNPSSEIWHHPALLYHYFTSEDMQEAYTHGFGFSYMAGQNLNQNFCYGIDLGLLAAIGTPVERPSSAWTVDSSSLFMLSLPINVLLMYPPRNDSADSFRPYAGIGCGVIIGIELMQAELSDFVSEVDVGNTIFRSAYTGEIVVGSEFGQWASNPFAELKFLISGRNKVSTGLTEEESERLDTSLYEALVRPEGKVTGAQIRLGFRW